MCQPSWLRHIAKMTINLEEMLHYCIKCCHPLIQSHEIACLTVLETPDGCESKTWPRRIVEFRKLLPTCRRVDEEHAALLSNAKPEGVFDSQSAEADSLRAKIQQGIAGLQQGLLERGTEVTFAETQTTLPRRVEFNNS